MAPKPQPTHCVRVEFVCVCICVCMWKVCVCAQPPSQRIEKKTLSSDSLSSIFNLLYMYLFMCTGKRGKNLEDCCHVD